MRYPGPRRLESAALSLVTILLVACTGSTSPQGRPVAECTTDACQSVANDLSGLVASDDPVVLIDDEADFPLIRLRFEQPSGIEPDWVVIDSIGVTEAVDGTVRTSVQLLFVRCGDGSCESYGPVDGVSETLLNSEQLARWQRLAKSDKFLVRVPEGVAVHFEIAEDWFSNATDVEVNES